MKRDEPPEKPDPVECEHCGRWFIEDFHHDEDCPRHRTVAELRREHRTPIVPGGGREFEEILKIIPPDDAVQIDWENVEFRMSEPDTDDDTTEENSPRKLQATTIADLTKWVNQIVERINGLQEGIEEVQHRSKGNKAAVKDVDPDRIDERINEVHDRLSKHGKRVQTVGKNTASADRVAEMMREMDSVEERIKDLEEWQETIMEVQSENRERIEQLEDAWKDAGAREEVVTDGDERVSQHPNCSEMQSPYDGEQTDSGGTDGVVWPLTAIVDYFPRGNQDPSIMVDFEDATGRTLKREKVFTSGNDRGAETFEFDVPSPDDDGVEWEYEIDDKVRDEQMVYDITGRFYDVDAEKPMYQLHDEDEEYNPITVSAANVEETWEHLGWGDTASPEEISTDDAHTETDR